MQQMGYYKSGRFVQRVRDFYGAEQGLPCENVLSLAYDAQGKLWAGTAQGLAQFDGKAFASVALGGESGAVSVLFSGKDGILWAAIGKALYAIKKGKAKLFETFDAPVADMTQDGDTLYLMTSDMVYMFADGAFVQKRAVDGTGKKLAVYAGVIHILLGENAMLILDGKRPSWKAILPMFAEIPVCEINDITFDAAGHLWFSTEEGAVIYDRKSYWIGADKIPNLPAECICTTVTDEVGGRYFASDNGVVRLKNGKKYYYGARRWLPANQVNALAVTADGTVVWAATPEGISRITEKQMTLLEKADYFQELTERCNIRDMGFVTGCEDIQNEDENTGKVHISDNDGLWTANYLAAQSFRYAATGDKDALEKARRSMQALRYLTYITGIPGFPARAIRREGEKGYGNGDKEWPMSPDGSCEWKCETSSDETTGHFFGFLFYYDFCANEEEKVQVKEACCGMVDHMLANDFTLVDHDGKRTTWAMWSPMMLNHDDKWIWEKGVNSLEFLMYLKVAYHMSGDEKYNKVYWDLIETHHYALNVIDQKIDDAHVTHIDDNLGFLSLIPLLHLEKDEALRSVYMMGLASHWQYERIERCPLWNLMYGAVTGDPCDLEAAVQSLREIPLSLIRYNTINSTRKGLVYDKAQQLWGENPQLLEPLSAEERPLGKYDNNPFRPDGGNSVSGEDGSLYLLPYWYARYYKLIEEEQE